MDEVEKLREEVEKIKSRNRRVEVQKRWETSLVRRIGIMLVTYVSVSIYFISRHDAAPFLSAIVPTLGFLLSTLSLGAIRDWWVERELTKQKSA